MRMQAFLRSLRSPSLDVKGSMFRTSVIGAFALTSSLSIVACGRGRERQAAKAAAKAAAEAPASSDTSKKVDEKKSPELQAKLDDVTTCEGLIAKICEDLGAEHFGCEISKEKIPPIGEAECLKLKSRYPALIKELQLRADVRKDATVEQFQAMIASSTERPGFGDLAAPVTIVEFLDFECPSCADTAATIQMLRRNSGAGKEYNGKIRYIARMYPLESLHRQAKLAGQAAMAAFKQGKFWDYHDYLFANQSNLERSRLLEFAKELNLDMEKFERDLDSENMKGVMAADKKLGEDVAVMATPTLFVNGRRVPPATLRAEIAAQLRAIDAAKNAAAADEATAG